MPPWRPNPWVEPLPDWYATKLEDVLPRRGFVFPKGHKIFDAKRDWVLVKWAIEAPAPNLEESEVDAALAAIMTDANTIADRYTQSNRMFIDLDGQVCSKPFHAIIEEARKKHLWTEIVPDGRFPILVQKLFRARFLYNTFTHIRGRPEEDKGKQEGKLAQAIDKWIGTHPVENADENYARTPQHLVDYMIDKLTKGEGSDWIGSDQSDTDSGMDTEDGSRSGQGVKGKKTSKYFDGDSEDDEEDEEDLGDEDAPWIPWIQLWYGSNGNHLNDDEKSPWVHRKHRLLDEDEDKDGDDFGTTNSIRFGLLRN
ncbi:hypothetical protein F4781DRAFT_222826 [Annulohypoxylon bovei var. microspora]|nr:hypothetical protein F4781DRAFT_222826 [Annulohypoxylon bovei var. microspora]